MTKQEILKVIEDWKYSWMNQTQNSKEDYENYFRRAFGVDSNMMHSLAHKVMEMIAPIEQERDEYRRELESAKERIAELEGDKFNQSSAQRYWWINPRYSSVREPHNACAFLKEGRDGDEEKEIYQELIKKGWVKVAQVNITYTTKIEKLKRGEK